MSNFNKNNNKSNINVNELKKAVENGNTDDFINRNLSPDAAKKVQNVLKDKSAMEKLLQTPQAKELFNKLMNK